MEIASINHTVSTTGKVPLSDRGRQREAAILRVATRHFLKFGYGYSTLDAIAKEAGGSKSTLYRFFPSKADLFHAVVASIVADERRVNLDPNRSIKECLNEFSIERLNVVFTKRHFSLLRLVIAERDRFPRMAESYFNMGPGRSSRLLVDYFNDLNRSRRLKIEDTEEAARHFTGMLMHDWYIRSLYLIQQFPSKEDKARRARDVVDAFLQSLGDKLDEQR